MAEVCVKDDIIEDIELFVFDKDGTLIDLYTYWYHMSALRAEGICSFYKLDISQHKKNLMLEMGVDIYNHELRPEGPVGLFPRTVVQRAAEEYLEKLNCFNVSEVCFRIFEKADELSLSLLDKLIKPLKGAIELLKIIKKKKAKIAIATADKTERAELAVKFLNIGDLIDFVVGADKVKHSKPAPDMLRFIEKSLHVTPAHSVMVGDAKTDVQMGVNAGYKASIAVCSGLTQKDVLLDLTPYVVKDISKICIM